MQGRPRSRPPFRRLSCPTIRTSSPSGRRSIPRNPALGVDPLSRRELMRVDWPQFNHDGGDLAFGPDGMLYISMGDGGGADDTDGQEFVVADNALPPNTVPMIGHQGDGNAQKLNTPLGKILRIDVNGATRRTGSTAFRPTTRSWARPARSVRSSPSASAIRSASRSTRPPAICMSATSGRTTSRRSTSSSAAATTDGTPRKARCSSTSTATTKALRSTVDNGRATPAMIGPIAQYDTHGEGHSVIGGFVYHGSRLPQLRDRYVFGEFSRVFNFPTGPHNFGRLLYLAQKHVVRGQARQREGVQRLCRRDRRSRVERRAAGLRRRGSAHACRARHGSGQRRRALHDGQHQRNAVWNQRRRVTACAFGPQIVCRCYVLTTKGDP